MIVCVCICAKCMCVGATRDNIIVNDIIVQHQWGLRRCSNLAHHTKKVSQRRSTDTDTNHWLKDYLQTFDKFPSKSLSLTHAI